MNEQIETIRQACIKANPEIVHPGLRRGVLCLVSKSGERFVTSYDVAIHDDTYEILEVFGRPIRLADVLLAMKVEPIFCGIEQDYFFLDFPYKGFENKRIDWNLRNDDLSQQSSECIEFLYELLK